MFAVIEQNKNVWVGMPMGKMIDFGITLYFI